MSCTDQQAQQIETQILMRCLQDPLTGMVGVEYLDNGNIRRFITLGPIPTVTSVTGWDLDYYIHWLKVACWHQFQIVPDRMMANLDQNPRPFRTLCIRESTLYACIGSSVNDRRC